MLRILDTCAVESILIRLVRTTGITEPVQRAIEDYNERYGWNTPALHLEIDPNAPLTFKLNQTELDEIYSRLPLRLSQLDVYEDR